MGQILCSTSQHSATSIYQICMCKLFYRIMKSSEVCFLKYIYCFDCLMVLWHINSDSPQCLCVRMCLNLRGAEFQFRNRSVFLLPSTFTLRCVALNNFLVLWTSSRSKAAPPRSCRPWLCIDVNHKGAELSRRVCFSWESRTLAVPKEEKHI